ncbi:MAG: serine/threonine-protein kinase [Polyangia bacterium]
MTSAQPAFRPGPFGRWQLLERIAVGGMAEIFKAKQSGAHGFEKTVVIKRILPNLASDPEFLAMFVDEAKLQCALEHPKIVQVFEFGEVDGQYFIAMEYVDGMDSLGLLRACAHRRQRLPVRLAVHIAAETLDALAYAHDKRGADGRPLGLVHRDISPSNILLARRGDVKLGDFGIAHAAERERQSKTQAGTLKGKYGYMAPEQVIGGALDARADIFAVGIVLAEMLMGRRLFTAPNDLDVLLMVRDARLERLDRYGADIPPPLRAILDKLLSKDLEGRYQRAEQAREALYDFLFDSRQRVTNADLAAYFESLEVDQPRSPSSTTDSNLMGEDTRAKAEAAARMQNAVAKASEEPSVKARALQIAREDADRKAGIEPSIDSGPLIVIEQPAPAAPTPAAVSPVKAHPMVSAPSTTQPPPRREESALPADFSGGFQVTSPVRLFSRLAAARETGQLVVQRAGIIKEIFLVDGAPEFIASNSPSERFGEYLVQQGVISPGELSMALAILPRFRGKLGDTLVGLNLLRPLEVFRYLTRQVREKMLEVFSWEDGTFRYVRGNLNSRESFPLGLDAFEIIGAGVAGLPLTRVRGALDLVADRRPVKRDTARPTPEHFRVGAGPRELMSRMDGKRTVGEWMKRYDQPDQLVTLCRTLYLLIEAELVTTS